jgi:succinate dehydrogenase / fumarate reductase cytochrome b subunit
MPVAAVLSILHRVAGVLLFAAFPFAVYFFDLSLRDPEHYARARDVLTASTAARIACAIALWALAHHLLSGIRYLLLDARVGVGRAAAQRSAWLVFALEIVAVVAAVKVLL